MKALKLRRAIEAVSLTVALLFLDYEELELPLDVEPRGQSENRLQLTRPCFTDWETRVSNVACARGEEIGQS